MNRWSLVEISTERIGAAHRSRGQALAAISEAGDEIYFVATDVATVDNKKIWSWAAAQASRRLARWTSALYGVREISAPVPVPFYGRPSRRRRRSCACTACPRRRSEPSNRAATVRSGARGTAPLAWTGAPYSPCASLMRAGGCCAYSPTGLCARAQTNRTRAGTAPVHACRLHEIHQQQVLGTVSYAYNDRHGGFVKTGL